METALIGIDWGTTHLRGFRVSADGRVLERCESPQGISAVQNGAFEPVLEALIGGWQTGNIPILMCGMIGSRQGWREVSYGRCPASVRDLVLQSIATSCGTAHIVGGLSARDGDGTPDIMRGEETQIFGMAPPTGRHLIIAPGTHSKWAIANAGSVETFQTYMTGEMFALLRTQSTLGWMMRDSSGAVTDEDAFRSGVRRAQDHPDLLHVLFGVRTRGLFENLSADALASYLSGLLIGSEIANGMKHHPDGDIIVIAGEVLGQLYETAFATVGRTNVRRVDGSEAVVQGLWRLWSMKLRT